MPKKHTMHIFGGRENRTANQIIEHMLNAGKTVRIFRNGQPDEVRGPDVAKDITPNDGTGIQIRRNNDLVEKSGDP